MQYSQKTSNPHKRAVTPEAHAPQDTRRPRSRSRHPARPAGPAPPTTRPTALPPASGRAISAPPTSSRAASSPAQCGSTPIILAIRPCRCGARRASRHRQSRLYRPAFDWTVDRARLRGQSETRLARARRQVAGHRLLPTPISKPRYPAPAWRCLLIPARSAVPEGCRASALCRPP